MEPEAQETIRRAEQDGIFKGQILTSLSDIKRSLDEIRDKQTRQDAIIEQKVNGTDFKDLRLKVEDLQKKVYIGVGILIVTQLVIALAK